MSTEELLHHVLDRKLLPLFHLPGLDFNFTLHLMMLWVVSLLVVFLVARAAAARAAGGGRLAAAVEEFIVLIREEVVYPAMGPKYGKKYMPFFLTIATLILVSNFIGLIPPIHIGPFVFGGTPTGNFWINLGLASLTYVYGIFCCAREHGLAAYFKSFLPGGVPWILAPLIWFIEFAGMFLKHIVLAIRLTANMMAGHLVLFAILGMVGMIFSNVANPAGKLFLSAGPVLLALGIYLLEVLVAMIQTAIFTILAAIFFGMAVNPHH
ncbi:MAG: ATP synthase F0 subunit A [Candidatus Hydrogenedentota bacterium]|nr:MAG: ATP synthase F0 subunit A [Candidatus Hydrogenedentota bacterium]